MRKFFLLILTMVATVCIAGTTGDAKGTGVETRKVKDFIQMRLEGAVAVYYSQGESVSVKVKAPSERMKDVKTVVDGKTLVVSLKGNNNNVWSLFGKKNNSDAIEVYVTSPDLVGISLHGSGDFSCRGKFDTDKMSIVLRGSGDITFSDIICDDIRTELVGSGDICLKKVDAITSEITLVGSGDISISQKNVRQTKVDLKGSGDIDVAFANCGTVDSNLRGSGDIRFSGVVKSLSKRCVGSGDYHTGGLIVKRK